MENGEESQLKRQLKIYKLIAVISVIINAILLVFLIGEYVGIWGGAYIRDPNNPGLPLTQILLGCF